MNLETALASDRPLDYRWVEMAGHYLTDQTFLLDNRWHRRQSGVDVITPFKLAIQNQTAAQNQIILVNRGWIASSTLKQHLPSLRWTQLTTVENISGQLHRIPTRQFILGHNVLHAAWPRRLQKIDRKSLDQQWQASVLPYVLRLSPNLPHGFLREWPVVQWQPQRHLAYAIQWFGLGLVLIIFYVLISRRPSRRRQIRRAINHEE